MPVSTGSLQRISQRNYGVDYPEGLRIATGIDLDPNGIAQQLYGMDLYGASDNLFTDLGGRFLFLPGTSGAYVSTPDSIPLSITGDLDIRIQLTSRETANGTMVAKWTATGGQQSYNYLLGAAFSQHVGRVSTTGANTIGGSVTEAVPFKDRTLRLAFDAGATDGTATFFFGPADFTTSTITSPPQTGPIRTLTGANAIFDSTAPVTIGATDAGATDLFQGDVYRVEIRNGIDGTVVASPDFRTLAPGVTSFADAQGNTWTINGAAEIR